MFKLLSKSKNSNPAVDLNDPVVKLALEVAAEVDRATKIHGKMNSPHEGHSVIREELEELWDHVKADTGKSPEAREEAIQVAAMGIKYALNLCE